ncbi:protein phosphatase [Streptomyces sp. PRKS01-29]|nr:protein phosphatase [Streptomyces sabulosicollis]MBI0296944.1 protein phosphatase [Streptomyces sabulosicollis]
MISLDGIPEFTGHLEQLEKDAPALKTDAGRIRKTGQGVHDQFQGLSAYYTAPEAEQLFATTRPVKEKADGFATKLEAVSSALSAYATEVRPIVERLKRLRADAAEFIRENGGDDDWKNDGDKVQHNNDLIADVGAATAAFEAAERSCANKISALVGGTHWVVDDGTHKPGMYGYTADVFQHAEKTPWGTQESQTHHWYDVGHWIKSFVWDGFIVDGVWGTIRGLGTMVGVDGWDAFKNSWANLGKLAVGLSLNTLLPGWYMTPDSMLPGFLKSTKQTMINTGKALVAWDEWGKNPARAAGAVTFNVLTAIATDGAGSATKSGAVARALSTAGKVGKIVDPMTYVFKGAGVGLSKLKVGDLVSHLKNLRAGSGAQLPDGSFKLPDNTVFRPDGSVELPDGSVLHKSGALELPDGTVHHPVHEPSAADRQALDGAQRPRQRELAQVGAPGREAGRAPDDLGPRASKDGPDDPTDDPPSGKPPEKHTPTTGGGSHTVTHDTGTPTHDPAAPGGGGTGPGGGGGGPGGPHDPGGPGGPHDPGGPGGPGGHEPVNEPKPELTPAERVAHDQHLQQVELAHKADFDQLKHDPDHKGKVELSEMDEARVALDLREQGKLPSDIQRPPGANQGDLYSPSSGRHYDIKGVHSDWPPFNNVRDKSLPFKGAYNPARNQKWVDKLEDQIVNRHRIVILDMRNANQAAIDDVKSIVEQKGWGDDVVWYP